RVLDGLGDVARGQALALRPRAHLRGDHDRVPVAPGGQPLADDRLGLAAGVARLAPEVGVRGVDEVPARGDVGVEDGEGRVAVGRPPEDVAAEAEPRDLEVARADLHHGGQAYEQGWTTAGCGAPELRERADEPRATERPSGRGTRPVDRTHLR